MALRWLLEHKSSRYEELLSRYTTAEQKLIVAIGKMGVVQKPTSRDFLNLSGLSIGAIQKAIKRLEDDADIYRVADGFELAEPLLTHYVKRFR